MLSDEEAEVLENAYNTLCCIDVLVTPVTNDPIRHAIDIAIKYIGAVRYTAYFEHIDWHPKYEVNSINGIPTIEAKKAK